MCGLTGIFYSNKEASKELTQASCDQLNHRGPDGSGVLAIDNICLGHRRLSIIDPSVIANQPMLDYSQNYIIVFNGEIFNFNQLKLDYLQNKGIEFKTNSDTEVLLYLLIHYGTECLDWLDGFFAFGFYSIKDKILILARDRFGKKPLLYFEDADYFAFASEMKALIKYNIPKEIDFQSLNHYFQFTYIPQTESIFKGVKKLQPGQYLTIKNKAITINNYFQLEIKKENYTKYTYEQSKAELINLLDKAVEKRLIADVPLGAFLSGGIDSSVVVALASKHTTNLNTFSIGYKDNPYYDETAYAELVSKKFKTKHTVFSITNNDYLDVLDDLIDYIDEPYADASAIPLYILSKFTKKAGMTVALSGDGGDELFAGYNKHFAEYQLRNPNLLTKTISALHLLWQLAPKGRNSNLRNKFRQLYKLSSNSKLSLKKRYLSLASFNHDSLNLFNQNIKSKIDQQKEDDFRNKITNKLQTTDLNEFLLTDFNFVLFNDMMVKVDLIGMANSLEIRSPFLDKNVIDFAFQIPVEYKIDNKLKKKIVQDAFRNILPSELYNRPKRGFEIPLNSLIQNELWDQIEKNYLNDEFLKDQNIFDMNYIKNLKNKMKSNNPEDSYITIWSLIIFQSWYKKYFLSE